MAKTPKGTVRKGARFNPKTGKVTVVTTKPAKGLLSKVLKATIKK